MRIKAAVTVFLLLSLSFAEISALAQDRPEITEEEFVRQAAICGRFEVMSSQLVAAGTDDVLLKDFAKKVAEDDTTSGKKLKHILNVSNTDIIPPDMLDEKHQKMLDNLADASGDKMFAKKYIHTQLVVHQEMLSLLQGYAGSGSNAVLKNFALETLPLIGERFQKIVIASSSGIS